MSWEPGQTDWMKYESKEARRDRERREEREHDDHIKYIGACFLELVNFCINPPKSIENKDSFYKEVSYLLARALRECEDISYHEIRDRLCKDRKDFNKRNN